MKCDILIIGLTLIIYENFYVGISGCYIYQGLSLSKEKGIVDLFCYSDSLLCINIITSPLLKFHAYAVLIQDIKELMEQTQETNSHTLREGNQCADSMVKLGDSSNYELMRHDSPPTEFFPLLQSDDAGTFYLRH